MIFIYEKDYFKFSSLIFNDEKPNKLFIGQKQIVVSKIYKMTKEEFNKNAKKFANSIKYKPTKTSKK